mmetsp:Transcript_21033/g.81292  ORF Transcript_21033/g.81292 Transcript_21033/m.81292 type:complete len:205 (-) Transcript_21033:4250-4864(-)
MVGGSGLADRVARVFLQHTAGDDDAHDFVGAFENLVHAGVACQPFQRKLIQVAIATVQLQGFVADGETNVGGEALGHRAVGAGLNVARIQLECRQAHHLARGNQLGSHVRQAELQRLQTGQRLAELLALVQVTPRGVKRALRAANGAGRNVDASAVQPLHRNAEALAFLAQQAFGADANVVERDGACGLAVPTHLVLLLAVADA